MFSMEQEQFVDAFVQYLDAVQEATCDRILEREPTPGKLKGIGKKLVEAAAPGIKGTAEKLSILVNVLEAQDQLVSRDYYEIKEVTDTLRQFGPHLEKNYGLALYAGVDSNGGNGNGTGYIGVCLGKTVTVEKGPLRSKIFVKTLVEQTCNRLRREKNDARRCVGWVDDEGCVYYDFDASVERAASKWKMFTDLGPKGEKEQSTCETGLMRLAYGDLFEKFRDDDGKSFSEELALKDMENTAIHEFHHDRIVGAEDACGHIREACAYLYPLSKAHEPLKAFDGLYSIYAIGRDMDETYRGASMLALDFLGKAGYSKDKLLSPDVNKEEAAVEISKQAKAALKLLEEECSLPKHEDVEALLKPDFDGYGAAIRAAVSEARPRPCKSEPQGGVQS